jgi:hypothetical protein
MNRKYLLPGLAALLCFGGAGPCGAQASAPGPAATATTPAPENLAIAREIIDIILPPENRDAIVARMSDTLMAQMRDAALRAADIRADPEVQRILDRFLERYRAVASELNRDGVPVMFEAMARAYARMFSHDDLVQIRAFAATPVGRRYFQQAPELFADPDVAEANRAQMARTLAAIQPLMEELRREIDAHAASGRPRPRR